MNRRNLNIDLIKILACFFVVALHTQRNYQLELIHNPILYYISRCAVPLFLMVNGYLLLKKERIDYKYVFHKIKNILIVILFWTFAYCILDTIRKEEITNIFDIFVGTFTQDGALAHLWFFWTLIIIYITLPILYKLKVFDDKNKFKKVIILMLVISVIIDIIFNYIYVIYNTNILKILLIYIFSKSYFNFCKQHFNIGQEGRYACPYITLHSLSNNTNRGIPERPIFSQIGCLLPSVIIN